MNTPNTTQMPGQNQVPDPNQAPVSGSMMSASRHRLKPGQFAFAGQVNECLPNTMFLVEVLESQIEQLVGTKMLCTLTGQMRLHRIRVLPGDKVVGYVTQYDLQHGKITFRIK
jgi:translation initiation factor IF-1